MAHLKGTRGDTVVRTATITDAAGAAYDLTGATLWFTVKEETDTAADDTAAVVSLYWVSGGAASGIAVATPSTGVAVITIPAGTTAALVAGPTYRYDLQVKDAAGRVFTVDAGILTLTGDTTRRTTTP